MTATYLSPQFQKAFADRLSFLYFDQQTALSETEGKAAFFVSLHAPENRLNELTNKQIWSIGLDSSESNTTLAPVLLRHLADKERWQAFFPSVNEWTKEYLIVFDIPAVTPNAPQLVQGQDLTLKLANADGKVELQWGGPED